MNAAITIELKLFLLSVLWGVLILLIYDIIRIIRRLINHNIIITTIQDILFWITVSLFIFAMLYINNDGIIRGFSVIGMGIGMILYHSMLSDWIVINITKIIQILLKPLRMLLGFLKKALVKLLRIVRRAERFLLNRLKKSVKSVKIKLNKKRQSIALKRKQKKELKSKRKLDEKLKRQNKADIKKPVIR